MATEKNAEARIKYLTDELHKAQMEINRLVLENQEQDFEIHRLKKLVNGLWNDISVGEYDNSTDDDDEPPLFSSERCGEFDWQARAQEFASAMQETLKKFELGYAKGFHDKQTEA